VRFTLSLAILSIVISALGACSSQPLAPATPSPSPKTGVVVDRIPDGAAPFPDSALEPAPGADAAVDVGPTVDVAPTIDAIALEVASETPVRDGAGVGVSCPTCAVPTSCRDAAGPGLSGCGPLHESCCESLLVPGGTFYRSYDGVSCPSAGHPADPIPFLGCYQAKDAPATVSSFRLDKYLVTIGRFRRFIDAVVAGWTPAAGAGRHSHLNGGNGVADLGAPGAFEAGWAPAWTAKLPRTRDDWDAQPQASWTGGPTLDDDRPVGGLLWAEAYAFCIWDGGFLPTEAEWNYAASGGDEQRVYPWSSPPASTTLDCAHAAFTGDSTCQAPDLQPVGSRSPAGDGRWGHADLVGLMDQWGLDWLADYVTPAVDGAQLQMLLAAAGQTDPLRVLRGLTEHGYADAPKYLVAPRDGDTPWDTFTSVSGVRCARPPASP
jgi:formylglycine-generating enzyme required for sulfatase activity